MNSTRPRLDQAMQTLRGAGGVAWAALALGTAAGAVTLIGLWQLGVAVVTPTPRPLADPVKTGKQVEQFVSVIDSNAKQMDGRTLFILPVNPKAAEEQAKAPEPDEPKEPPAPTVYAGPSIIAMVNGSVWFDNGDRLTTGEESSGVKVMAVRPPWDAKLNWRGVDFTVPLFERDKVVAPKATMPGEAPPEPVAAIARPDAKPEATPEAKPNPAPESKPDPKPDAKPDTKPDTKPQTKPEPKPEQPPPAKKE